jgi:hypothetical protein
VGHIEIADLSCCGLQKRCPEQERQIPWKGKSAHDATLPMPFAHNKRIYDGGSYCGWQWVMHHLQFFTSFASK